MTYSPKFRGNTSQVGARNLVTGYQNGSGATMNQCTPAAVNTIGQIEAIDVSDVNSVNRFVGLVAVDVPQAATGPVVDGGRIEEVTIGFVIGDALYVSKAGFLTTTKPEIGADGFEAGDFIIFVGVMVKNEFDSSKKDLKLLLSVIGQL